MEPRWRDRVGDVAAPPSQQGHRPVLRKLGGAAPAVPAAQPETKRITGRWQEPGHYLKFEIAGIGDIDILVTRTWLEPPSVRTLVSGTPMAVQRPAEVIARKIAYRAAGFKLRDFFDLAALARYDIEQIGELRGLIETIFGDLRSRWTVLVVRLPEQLEHEVTPVGDGNLVADSLGLIVEQVLSGRQTADGYLPLIRPGHIGQTLGLGGSADWNLSDRQANAARAAGILRHQPVVLEDFPVAELVHLAGEFGGQYALISKRDKLLEYYVHYEIHVHPMLGRCATRIKLWRSRTATVQGLASRVFDTYLLGGFDTIVSDLRQTGRGREFWEVQLAGHSQSKTIGLLVRDEIKLYDRALRVDDWLASVDGWGRAASFRQMRFFISNIGREVVGGALGPGSAVALVTA